MAHVAELTPGTDSSGRRFTDVAGPAGGRLFQNPNLATLDKLLGAQKDLPTAAGRRGAGAAFSNFSAFLDLQDRRKVARQNADLRQQAAKLEIQKQEIANQQEQKKLAQRPTTDLTPDLIALSSRPRQEFLAGMSRLRESGTRLKSSDLINLNNANLSQQRVDQSAQSEERIQETAEARTPDAKLKAGVALVEKELKRKMTRAEKIRFSSSKTRGDLLQELSEEVEAGPADDDKPFTQEPEQAGKTATRAEVGDIVRKLGSTDPEEINAALVEAGFAPLGS